MLIEPFLNDFTSFVHDQQRMMRRFHQSFLKPRAVRYGIVFGHAAQESLEDLKAQAQAKIEQLQQFIEDLERLDEELLEAKDDTEEKAKPKAKTKRKPTNSKQAKGK